MELYLMQHGLALSREEDPERSLSPSGIGQVKASAAGMKNLLLAFDLVVTSPKRRAQQTAALVAEALRYPYSDILTSEVLLPDAETDAVGGLLDGEKESSRVLLVGHLPHLAKLSALLLEGAGISFENAGLAGLQQDESGRYALKFLLTADQLARLHK